MDKWLRLTDFHEATIRLGTVFRLPAQYPYEAVVEFLLYQPNMADSGLGLMVSSGYKAGLTLVILPASSWHPQQAGLSSQWLRDNWRHWVYPDCAPEQVWLNENRRRIRLPG